MPSAENLNGNGNGNRDLFSGMPWWVRAVALVGVPTIISLWLVGQTTGELARNITKNKEISEVIAQRQHEQDESVTRRFLALERYFETSIRLQRIACRGSARTDAARDKCDE
jgi:hypothetical protein